MKITVNATTLLWHAGTTGAVIYPPYEHTSGVYPQGPYACEQIMTPLNTWDGLVEDPAGAWYPPGGAYWKINAGPYIGKLVYLYTNERGYGDITLTPDAAQNPDWVPPPEERITNINPLADWRILIKAMAGGGGGGLTVPSGTILWHTGTTGAPILPPTEYASVSGTYTYESVMLPLNHWANQLSEDPSGAWFPPGGSFYRITSGPYSGKYVYKWSAERGYGDIVAAPQAGAGARGPGEVLAIIHRPEAHLAGASINYNAAGELHFTLLVDDPNILVPQPKRTHYAVEFEATPGAGDWVEVFAGLIWDIDATDTEVVFLGLDYLGLLGVMVDERFDPNESIEKPTEQGGSKYTKKTIKQILADQLNYAISLPNSPVGFMEAGHIDDDLNKYRISTIYSTFANIFDFCIGLINSYRAGTGMYTRLQVVKVGGQYKFLTTKDPGQARRGLALEYGGLAQGYHVIPFGPNWGTRAHLIGRNVKGLKVNYSSQAGAAIEAEWGRVSTPAVFVETQDNNDLIRRSLQAAVDAAALGRQISAGIKLGAYRPLEGYDITDWVPVDIEHGAVNTQLWGSDPFGGELVDDSGIPVSSGMWAIIGLKWESYDDGHWMSFPALWPKNHVPYEPGGEEPDYSMLVGRGGCGAWAAEFTGTMPDPAFQTNIVFRGAFVDSVTMPASPALDPTRAFIAFVGIKRESPAIYNGAPPAGWTRDYDDAAANGAGIYVMHQMFDPVTNPLPATLAPIIAFSGLQAGAAIMTGFYADEPGVPIAIRQTYHAGSSIPGDGVGIVWDQAPVSGSVQIAYVATGGYFGASGPYRAAIHSGGYLPKENLYTHVGWSDIGINNWDNVGSGRIVDYTEYGDGTYLNKDGSGFVCEYRDSYSDPDVHHEPTSFGVGPPTTETEKADVYTDTATGIEYTYDWASGTWHEVPGTGNVASGLFDFVFVASDTWVVTHTLGGYPRVTVIDSTGAVVNASIHYDSTTQITITFSSDVAGRVHLG